MELTHRPRRLRRNAPIRSLVRETLLAPQQLIYPLFVAEGNGLREPISTMPGQYRLSVDELVKECQMAYELGIGAVNLFGYSTEKDDKATKAYDPHGLVQRAIRAIKAALPDLCVQTDVALDPYTIHGHDGLVVGEEIVNDETVEVLCRMAVSHAEAGADWIAPSDMMDGRVGAIREALDASGFEQVSILAYTAKYASCFYGPFRGALESAPKKGDKKTYQMDPANSDEAMREVAMDITEGADMVMVKPGIFYLDIVRRVKDQFGMPTYAYQVSGEFAMMKSAAMNGWLDWDRVIVESLLAFKRAGADGILTYAAIEVAERLKSG